MNTYISSIFDIELFYQIRKCILMYFMRSRTFQYKRSLRICFLTLGTTGSFIVSIEARMISVVMMNERNDTSSIENLSCMKNAFL